MIIEAKSLKRCYRMGYRTKMEGYVFDRSTAMGEKVVGSDGGWKEDVLVRR